MSLKCAYHPERDASTKCEKCGKVICLECKQAFTTTHGTEDSRYSVRHEYCQVCYYDYKIKSTKYSPIACVFGIIFFIIGLIMVNTFISNTDISPSALSIPITIMYAGLIISIILSLYLFLVYRPKKMAFYEDKKQIFLSGTRKAPSVKEEKPVEKFCSECGSKLEPGESVCSYCGSVIKESSNDREKSGTTQEGMRPRTGIENNWKIGIIIIIVIITLSILLFMQF